MVGSRIETRDPRARDLPRGGARVYYVFQDALDTRLRDRLRDLLSAEERVRQERFQHARDRDLFLLAHGMLRQVLAEHTGVTPHCLRFETGAYGRPELSGPAEVGALRFNLSHTPGLATCVVANGRAVGVDAENRTRRIDLQSVSARVFSREERRGLDSLSGEEAAERFFLLWTLKEAYIKALGLGFSLPLRRITTRPTPDERAALELDDMEDDADRWTLHTHRPGPDHQIAVALEAPPEARVTFEEFSLA